MCISFVTCYLLLAWLLAHCYVSLSGLFPAILNLASNAIISSNATCGDPEPEVYCKLVEHVPGRRIKNPHCPKCDANSVLSKGTTENSQIQLLEQKNNFISPRAQAPTPLSINSKYVNYFKLYLHHSKGVLRVLHFVS